MKRLSVITSIAALVLGIISISSCNYYEPVGKGTPVETDKSEVAFTAEGGEETVTATNQQRWWIHCGFEDIEKANAGDYEGAHMVFATSSDGEEAYTYDILDAGWYHATVPNKGKSNQLIIKVDKNTTGNPRHAIITMSVGNTGTQILVSQE